jgi:Glyoxalase-like domain
MPPQISRRTFLALTGAAMAVPRLPQRVPDVPTVLDHILLGCNDLQRGIEFVEQRTGVRAAFGGVHPGRGTQNALLALGERRYLEVIAPDPQQNVPDRQGIFKSLTEPRLIGWAAHPGNLEEFAAKLRANGVAFDGPQPGSRRRPDGRVLNWRTVNLKDDHGGLLPFFIEWSADSVHPSADAPKGCTLLRFTVATPEQDDLLDAAKLVQLDLLVSLSDKPGLQAAITGPKGELVLTS